MWPCNSIIIAFVWFVTHGKWTRAFQCGYCLRLVIHAGFQVTPQHWMESQREGVSSSQCVSKTQVLWWTWGQCWCPWRAPGHPAQDSEGTAPEPRKCLPGKRSCSPILCAHFASQWVFVSKEDSQAMRAAGTWDVPSLTWGGEMASPGAWTCVPDCPQQPPEFSRGLLRSVSPCPAPPHTNTCCSTAGALKRHSNRRLLHSKAKDVMDLCSS